MRFPRSLPARLAPRLQLGVVLTLLLVGCGAGALLYSVHRRDLLDGLQGSLTVQGALVEQSLRHAMLDRDHQLLSDLVNRLRTQEGVEEVLLIDKEGTVRFSSDSALVGVRLDAADPTCLICHEKGPDDRGRTVTFQRGRDDRVMRNVTPIRNGPECYGCHLPTDRVNGVFVIDHSLRGVEARLRAEAAVFAAGTLLAMLLLAIVLEILLHKLVLRPIAMMKRAIAAAEGGDLQGGVALGGADEMSRLAQEFNRMSQSLGDSMALLQERETYLQRILDSAEDAMVVVDRDLRVVTSNDAYSELCMRTKREIVGQVCLFSPQCHGERKGDCPSWSVFTTGETQRSVRRIVDGSGGTKTYEIFASPLEVDGAIQQALEVWRDISERTRLEAELAHSERLASLGFLASGISHELNNPLATITTCLDGLQRRYEEDSRMNRADGDVAGEYFILIQREIQRCRDLTTKLMLLSRRSSSTWGMVDLNALIDEQLSLLSFELRNRHVTVDCRLAPQPLLVRGDEARLRQVILNLFLNALDAIDDGGSIRVLSVRQGMDGANVTIMDDGCGIDAAHLEKIFEPFFSKRRTRSGTGLGLFISNQIVQSHGGRIGVESTVGKGTTVSVSIPTHGGRADGSTDLRTPGR